MSQKNEYYLTPEGAAKLRAELAELSGPKREALSKRLRTAIQQGDLSENADYSKAKEDQAFLEGRIQELEIVLSKAVIVEGGEVKAGEVGFGSWVTIQEGKEEPERYRVVGPMEANPKEGRISDESPIGGALMGHKEGDTVAVKTPNGQRKVQIIKVE